MNKEEIVAIAVRLFAIALAIYGLNHLPGMVMYFEREETQNALYIFSAISILIFLTAVLLWNFPLSAAKKITPKSGRGSLKSNWNYEELLTCGFVIMGIYFLFYAISDSIYWLYVWKMSASFEGSRVGLNIDQVARIYSTVAEFIISTFLILGSSGLSGILIKLRYAGLNPSND